MDSILQDLNNIAEQTEKILASVAADLFAELQLKTPVDTGQLRQSWALDKVSDGFEISNNLSYASIIFDGRKIVNGKAQGSTQLAEGIQPILDKYNRRLEIELRRI